MLYRRSGRSGLLLPAISLGLWQGFGHARPLETSRAIVRRAFDLGITHFDLANNYGPPYGSAEENFGELMRSDLAPYRDELVISTKAGYDMWPGPYGDRGSRKYLLASLDQSLGRMGLEYVDIFYSHRADPDTPLEETMGALATAVAAGQGAVRGHLVVLAGADRRGCGDPARPGHAAPDPPAVLLAVEPLDRGRAARHARARGRRLHHVLAARAGAADGQVPARHSRGVAREPKGGSLSPELLTDDTLARVRALNEIARGRGQSLAQMALAWTLRDPRVTSTLVGASSVAQLEANVGALDRLDFTHGRARRDRPLRRPTSAINLWAPSSAV